MTRHAIRQTIQPWLDDVERRVDDTQEYYSLNSVSGQQLCELEDALVKWLQGIGFKFE